MILNPIVMIILIAVLIATTYSDLKHHKIKNYWIISGILLAFITHAHLAGLDGIFNSLAGLIVGLVFFLPLYITGGMAAGDVKLMAAVGTLLGLELAWMTVLTTLISGGILALSYLLIKGDLKRYIKRWSAILSNVVITRNVKSVYIDPAENEVARQSFPYALAITLGVLISLTLFRTNLPAYMLVSI